MRRDRRAVVISVVGITLVIAAMAGVGYRMFDSLSGGFSFRRSSERSVSMEPVEVPSGRVSYSAAPQLDGFDEIAVVGSWSVSLKQGAEYAVQYSAGDRAVDRVEIYTRGDRLYLALPPGVEIMNPDLSASVTLPQLARVDTDGGASLSLLGFETDSLHIEVDGAASVTAVDCSIGRLVLDTDGAATLDFSGSHVENAEVTLDGATNLNIRMDGGNLTGVLRGIGDVQYSGDVSRQSIDIEGLGRVRRR
jgi:hypothetical protein